MEPNQAFLQRKRGAESKKKCQHCGRTWRQSVTECLCGNKTRWISYNSEGNFNVWECRECGNKINLYGGVLAGLRWIDDHEDCQNCGHPRPGWKCVS